MAGISRAAAETLISAASLAANTTSALSTAVDCSTAAFVQFELECDFHADATAGGTVKIYGSMDGTTYRTREEISFTGDFTAGASDKVGASSTFACGCNYYKATLTNDDAGQAIANYAIRAQKTGTA